MAATHRVLIVDDDAVSRRLAQVVFQKHGWWADTADSGECALLHVAAHRYDLVLLDISLPGLTGQDVCAQLRADPQRRTVRVIAYTAHAYPEQQQRFLDGGFDAVLVKPLRVQALHEMIQALTPCQEPALL
jgi:CheY-like chemotaxis protein